MLFSKKKARYTFAVLTLTYDNRPLRCLLVPGDMTICGQLRYMDR